jgi:hydrogenase nickel incorporation protein HypB
MYSLLRRPCAFHHDPGHPHRHDSQGAVIETQSSGTRRIQVIRNVLDANRMVADGLRRNFAAKDVFVINVMSSPGSGKTTTLIRTLDRLMPQMRCAVIVGDICSTHDADKLSATGAPVVQINTDQFGGECHLAAHVIETAVGALDLEAVDLLIVENIGNLVCPAEFDIGEDLRVVMLSVTEGEDKPIKYPLMFRVCDAALVNKIDLLPYLDLTGDAVWQSIRQVHPDMPIFNISAKTGEGFDDWVDWLTRQVAGKQSGK